MLRLGKDSVMIWQGQPDLRASDEEKEVGRSAWSAIPAKDALEVAIRAIRDDANITHCDECQCG